ncbi:hypothetical protein LTR15_003184 [Elasticomyces elasticus]|nr:hypothetical protein LTR15_003184 [Elasticomyces elasticus]
MIRGLREGDSIHIYDYGGRPFFRTKRKRKTPSERTSAAPETRVLGTGSPQINFRWCFERGPFEKATGKHFKKLKRGYSWVRAFTHQWRGPCPDAREYSLPEFRNEIRRHFDCETDGFQLAMVLMIIDIHSADTNKVNLLDCDEQTWNEVLVDLRTPVLTDEEEEECQSHDDVPFYRDVVVRVHLRPLAASENKDHILESAAVVRRATSALDAEPRDYEDSAVERASQMTPSTSTQTNTNRNSSTGLDAVVPPQDEGCTPGVLERTSQDMPEVGSAIVPLNHHFTAQMVAQTVPVRVCKPVDEATGHVHAHEVDQITTIEPDDPEDACNVPHAVAASEEDEEDLELQLQEIQIKRRLLALKKRKRAQPSTEM